MTLPCSGRVQAASTSMKALRAQVATVPNLLRWPATFIQTSSLRTASAKGCGQPFWP